MTARQSRTSVSTPPSKRPTDAPLPAMAPKMPNALPRSLASTKVVVSSDSAAGASSAPNSPCSTRAPVSIANDPEAPPTADAIAKPARPPTNVHLRPKMSLILPPSRSMLPKASE